MNQTMVMDYTNKIVGNVSKIIYGKEEVMKQVLVCFLGGGHVLLEDVPGTGKTMLLRAFSKSIGGDFKRIQFTPDLLPSDLTGIHFYNQKVGEFEFRQGPLFANIVLADEINRATPRTQAALLETMEEKQISIDGTTYPMEEPYMVMATQNPIESYGTFPLPEAQMDRFFMRLSMGYMEKEQEIEVLRRKETVSLLEELQPVVSKEELFACKEEIAKVKVSDEVVEYMMNIITATREDKHLVCGVSTRGGLALYKASQIVAAMEGRDYVIPEDVKREAMCVLPHRIPTGNTKDAENYMEDLLTKIAVPLERL